MYNKNMEILSIALSILSAISYNQTIDFNVFFDKKNNICADRNKGRICLDNILFESYESY